MAVLTPVDQFPTFAQTLSWLKKGTRQCIYYLPSRKRCCACKISKEINQSAFNLAQSISKADPLNEKVHNILVDIAEKSCCGCHHRNYMWSEGSGLGHELAVRWQNEIQATLSVADFTIVPVVKLESVSASSCTISKSSSKPIAFLEHEVREIDTLISKLLLPISSTELKRKPGYLYLYTHEDDVFRGMVKIGYTCTSITTRLDYWNECSHGYPVLLDSYNDVEHAERVELLTHFELLKYWHALRWCGIHSKPHIEWFKIDIETASSTVHLWSKWIKRANPYDRRGQLKKLWREAISFLTTHEIPIGAEVLMQVQELEESLPKLREFIDDDALRMRPKQPAKQEQSNNSQTVFVRLPQRLKAGHGVGRDLEIKSDEVKIEVKELLSCSETVTTTEVVTSNDD